MKQDLIRRLRALPSSEAYARARVLAEYLPYFREQLTLLDEEGLRKALAWPPQLPDPADIQPWDGDFAAQQARMRRLAALARVQTVWWEFGAQQAPEQGWLALSRFCDALIAEGARVALGFAAMRRPMPAGFRWLFVALGKLGGEEVNLASDWDLVWVWDAEEQDAAVFAQRALQLFVRLFGERTPEGQAWRVDLRLRPGGEGAPAATRLAALVAHLESYAQTWERAAWLRARPIAGDAALAEEVERLRKAFVFRRHLDYAALAALAGMKARMDAQAKGEDFGPGWDIKRGRGGIREAEFFVQAMQLIYGGRKPALRVRAVLEATQALANEGLLAAEEAQRHAEDYKFLRRLEHAWQAARGDVGHRLDADAEAVFRAALADFQLELAQTITERVAARFRSLFAEEKAPAAFPWDESERWADMFPETHRAHVAALLQEIGAWLDRGLLPERAHREVAVVLCEALPAWAEDANGVRALSLFVDLLRNISGRAHWMDLLAHHEGARRWLIGVLAAGRFLAERVARDPAWLEWPLAAERGEAEIAALVRAIEAACAHTGEEARARIARAVDQARITLALAWDAHRLRAHELAREWSCVAEAAVRACLAVAMREMGIAQGFPFAIVAMGKLGAQEMSLASDLDLVFLTEAKDFARAQRLGRRVIALLSATPPFGPGLAVDMRLRPSGRQGILVSTLAAFEEYQHRWALTWEHQALVRARVIAGPEDLRSKVEAAIAEVLAMPRNPAHIAAEMRAMRAKMEAHHAADARFINLKHGAGGMSDIEFLAQFVRLIWHEGTPSVLATLQGLSASIPKEFREAAPFLAETYADFMQAREALWIELEAPCERIPRDPSDAAWRTLARHTAFSSPQALLARMQMVRERFLALLAH